MRKANYGKQEKELRGRADARAAGSRCSSSRKKQRKTYVSKTVKIVLVVIGVLAMLLSVSAMACSGLMSQAEDTSSYKLTGGVAATINGTNLTEDTVTKQIMSMRTSYGYTKDKDWRSIWSTTI